jgi:ribosome-associated translation inhibitor RaiA
MKTTLRFVGLNTQVAWRRLVDQQINHLQTLTLMTAASVVLEHQREAKPAFRVKMLLEVSGPDLHAETTDHTLEAALSKATQNLEHQIKARGIRRIARRKSQLQSSASSSRGMNRQAGQRM